MHYRNKIAMLVAATFSQQLWAQSVSGVVLDHKGQPIAGAEVSLAGSQARVKTDAAGTFLLAAPAGQLAELHVEAPQFAHRNLHLNVPEAGLNNVELRLAPTLLEVIDVKASPLHASATESALPVTVLSGEQLKMQQASTLGDTLKNQVGVHSNFYGSVASSPIIRGLDGPRVLITQNGLDAGDASRVGPDHSVASEAGTAEQIEVLRGPATLFYGSGAIGGVVNVVDERVPTRRDTQANWQLERQSVNNEKLAAAAGQTSVGDVALYADAFWRDQDNYKIPGVAETGSDEAAGGRVANTDAEGKGGTLGASYLLPNGFVGLSVGRLERQYGIPGHSHGGHDHEEEGAEHAEERVFADLEQDRVQLHSQLNFSGGPLAQLNVKAGYTDYQHAEIEGGAIGTTFKNRSDEARLELLHREWLDWRGGLSLHYKHSDFAAVGDEAFTPPSTQEMLAVGWMEERHFGPLLLQTGARLERVTLKADQVLLPELAAHAHDGSEHDDHDHGGDQLIRTFAVDQNFKPYSLSAGLVWEYQDGYNAALSLSRSGRAPSAAELLSFGPHIGTNAYEIGALFRLNPTQDPHQAFALNKDPVDLEVSNNIDLTWRKYSGDVALILNAFYNQVDNYYYQQNTGLFAEDGHDHADHAEAEHADEAHDHSGELPVYLFRAADVTLHGFEAQLIWQFAPAWRWTQQVDYVRARLDAGGDLPRTPPLRLQSALSWQSAAFSAELRYSHYSKQDKVETLESATGSYNLLDANVSYYLDLFDQQLAVYLKGQNLTDEDARVHTSFLKDKAPLPGRSIGLGIRGEF
ncbi:TonB-dependent receptor [Rheinheimera texasensis]|uniref:TonB-dependent receptor n=1 Tax=Rheinheimera texasensis TaxID=306205 RepID=UPI0004E18ACB|nr:TonB-dependent receptor [Rheinheimera texasensis]